MVGVGTYRARRRRSAEGLVYELMAGEEPTLEWTADPYGLGADILLSRPDGTAYLRITSDEELEYVDAPWTVLDGQAGEPVGAIRLNLRSLLRRHWGLLDPHGIEVGTAVASSRLRAVIRSRWLRFVPYRYDIQDADGAVVGDLHGSLRPGWGFSLELTDGDAVDPRLSVAAAAVVDAFEFR